MKKFSLLFIILMGVFTAQAQINTPAPSPFSKLEQKVGLSDVTVAYSRPSMRGRTIFGDLVPYDQLWRTGANSYTLISFSTDVKIDGKDVKAGTYSIFTKPGKTSWEVFFYTDTQGGGTPSDWDDNKVVAKVTVPVNQMQTAVETFTIDIDDLNDNGATLGMLWEKTYVGVKFEVPTDAMVTASIDKVMAGPGAGDYYAAAVYYLNANKDISKAKEWMEKAMSMTEKPAYWQLRQQSLIYAKAGDKKAAIESAKKSLAAAETAGNMDYVKMNKDSLKEWGAM
ncbi:MAG: DUF2911 domain-containing protein [Flavobacteriales bacterium]|nr:MAG: DUF2911 domain-containing protein [Flavobacteriales bacterium]